MLLCTRTRVSCWLTSACPALVCAATHLFAGTRPFLRFRSTQVDM